LGEGVWAERFEGRFFERLGLFVAFSAESWGGAPFLSVLLPVLLPGDLFLRPPGWEDASADVSRLDRFWADSLFDFRLELSRFDFLLLIEP
jgi:hypothetical protein